MNKLGDKVAIINFHKATALINTVRYTDDPMYVVHYVYDRKGYIERVPVVKTKKGNFFDFSRIKHNNIGLVPVPELGNEKKEHE